MFNLFISIDLKGDSEDSGLDTASVASFESENEDHQEKKHTGRGNVNTQYIMSKYINSSFIGKKRKSKKDHQSKGKF